LGEFSGILSKSYAPHCRVLSPGKFKDMSSQSQVPRCRVLSPGKINVTIPEPRATEPGATLQGAAI